MKGGCFVVLLPVVREKTTNDKNNHGVMFIRSSRERHRVFIDKEKVHDDDVFAAWGGSNVGLSRYL